MTSNETYQIGVLASRSGVTPDTLRYYERVGLLPPPQRTSGGFRVYAAENGLAEVTYDPAKTTPEKIAKAITENSGFKAELQPSPKSSIALTVEGLPRRGQQY